MKALLSAVILWTMIVYGMENEECNSCSKCEGFSAYTWNVWGVNLCLDCLAVGIYNYYREMSSASSEELKTLPSNFYELDQEQDNGLKPNQLYEKQNSPSVYFDDEEWYESMDAKKQFHKISDNVEFNKLLMNKMLIRQLFTMKEVSEEIQENWIQHFIENRDKIPDNIWKYIASFLNGPTCQRGHNVVPSKERRQKETHDECGFEKVYNCKECEEKIQNDENAYGCCKRNYECEFYDSKELCYYEICQNCHEIITKSRERLKALLESANIPLTTVQNLDQDPSDLLDPKDAEIKELKMQLALKDIEIEELKTKLDLKDAEIEELKKKL